MASARRSTWIVALVAVAAALLPAFVGTAPATAASQLEVDAGYGGYHLRGRSYPVTVELTADRLVQGRLEVTADSPFGGGQGVTVALPVEVPGGGAKRYVVTLPSSTGFDGGAPVNVRARLVAGDGAVVATSPEQSLRAADDRELVGVLPGAGVTELPGSLPLAIDAGVASFFAIGPAELAQAPAALDPLGTIAVGADELAQLDAATRRGVLAWLERGGTLLVGAAPGAPIEGLPEAWQPDASGRAFAGLGRVQLVGDRLRTGNWAGLIYPTPASSTGDPQFGPFMPQSIGAALGVDAGLRVPQLGWLLLFLLTYAAIVGPITAIVLGRVGRAELAWVVIPAVAVVFTAGTWAIAQGLRSSTGLAHAEIVELSPAGARSTAFLGVAARGRNDLRIGAGADTWTARQYASVDGPAQGRIVLGASGPEAAVRLSAGQFAVAQLTAPAAVEGGLEVEATSVRDGEASGQVRNTGTVALEEVAVFIGTTGTSVGRLEPGEEQPWTTTTGVGGGGAQRFPMDLVDGRLWSRASGIEGPIDPESVVNYAAWAAASPWAGANRPSGIAVAVGWTREGSPALRIDGDERSTSGRRALVATAPVAAPGALTDMTIRGEPVRPSLNGFVEGGNGSLGSIVRFTLPPGARPAGALQARIPMAGRVELWDGRAWVTPQTGPAVFGGGDIALGATVPPEAVFDGQVFLRVDNMQMPMVVGSLTMVAIG